MSKILVGKESSFLFILEFFSLANFLYLTSAFKSLVSCSKSFGSYFLTLLKIGLASFEEYSQ